MLRVIGFVIGAAAFLAAHALEASHWSDWFNGQYDPWFLNSGRAILFTLGLLWVASTATAALTRSPRQVSGLAIGGGTFVGMAVVLFTAPNPGTLFPIVLGAGGVPLLCTSLAGAWAGTAIKCRTREASKRHDRLFISS
jgi:hypothetical protein